MTGKTLANFISLFIPSKTLRHRIRKWKGFETKYDKLKQDLEYIKRFLQYTAHPCDIPPVQGITREVQLQLTEKLVEFANVCDKHGIDYWLDYGTLLGAARNKGFLPWDDDIDVGIRWEDRERLIEAMKENHLQVEVPFNGKGEIRVTALDTNCVPMHIDVFGYKEVRNISSDGAKDIDKYVLNSMKKFAYFNMAYQKAVEDYLAEMEKKHEGSDTIFVRGLDVVETGDPSRIIPKEMIFPLTTITYEGKEFKAPRFYLEYLTLEYGDFMQWPPSFKENDIYRRLSLEDKIHLTSRMYRDN